MRLAALPQPTIASVHGAAAGAGDRPGPFFMNDDGRWYGADSLLRVRDKPTHYKPCERAGR